VRTCLVGERLRPESTDEERARRCEIIARQMLAFAHANQVGEAWIEGYAFAQRTSAHTLAEVGGCVRLELMRAGTAIRTANMGTARKLLLGRLPRNGAKYAAHAALHAAGAPPWTLDEADAFVAANLGLSEHAGAWCFRAVCRGRMSQPVVVITPDQLQSLLKAAVHEVFTELRQDVAPVLLDRNGVAQALGCSPSQIDRLRRFGMPFIRLGDVPRFEFRVVAKSKGRLSVKKFTRPASAAGAPRGKNDESPRCRGPGRPSTGQLIWRTSGWAARFMAVVDGERVRVCRPLGTDNKAVARRKLARLLESNGSLSNAEVARPDTFEEAAVRIVEGQRVGGLETWRDI
jgi:hypothetical protein